MKNNLLLLLMLIFAQVAIGAEQNLMRTIEAHSDTIYSVAYSPDGKFIASGNDNATVKIWDASTGAEVRTLSGHTMMVQSVSYSPDGKHIASGSQDNTIKIWNASTGAEIMTLSGHSGFINSVSYSHDGKYLASGSDDRTISIWEISSRKEIKTIRGYSKDDHFLSVSWSPDDKYIAAGSWDKTITIWDASSGKDIRTIKGFNNSVDAVSFSPDGKCIASASGKTIKIWFAASGEELMVLWHSDSTWCVSYSRDGKYLATGSSDKTVKLWDAFTGKEIRTFRGHLDVVCSVRFSPDNNYIASGSSDKTIKIWVTPFGEQKGLKGTAVSDTNETPGEAPKTEQSYNGKPEFSGPIQMSHSKMYRIVIYIVLLFILIKIMPSLIRYIKLKVATSNQLTSKIEESIVDIEIAARLFEKYMKSKYFDARNITTFKPATICKIYKHLDIMDKTSELPLSFRESMFDQFVKNREFEQAYVIFKTCPPKTFDSDIIIEMHEKLGRIKNLINYIQSTPANKRSASDWELLIYAHDNLDTLRDLNPSDLPYEHRKKVMQLLEKKKDTDGLMNFIQFLPPDKRSSSDWELLISTYDKLNKLGDLNPSDLPDDQRKKVIQLMEKNKNNNGVVSFIQSIPLSKRSAADWELLISAYDKLNLLGELKPSDLPDDQCKKLIQLLEKKKEDGLLSSTSEWELLISLYEKLNMLTSLNPSDLPEGQRKKVIQLLEKKKDPNILLNFVKSLPADKRTAADWELLISLHDKHNTLGSLNPSELPEDQRKKVIQLLENKKDYNNLLNFVRSLPADKRTASDWELLISLYEKLNMLGDLNPSDLTEDQRKKVIQILENKKDYNSLMNFANSIPVNERSEYDWDLLVSSYDKLNILGDLNPSDLNEVLRKKVIQLMEKKKDYNGLKKFANSIPLTERSEYDWELLISSHDKLNKLGDLNPSELPEDHRKKIIQLMEAKKDHNGLLNFVQLIPPEERSEPDWELLISLYDKLNKLGDLIPSDLSDDNRNKVIQLFDRKKDYNGLMNFLQSLRPEERSESDWELLISSYDKLNKLSSLNPSDVPDDHRRQVIQLFERRKDNDGMINFVQLIPPNERTAADWELLISLYDRLNKLGGLNPTDLTEDYRKKVIQLLENKRDYTGLANFIQLIPPVERSTVDWELLISSYDKIDKLGSLDPTDLPEDHRRKVIQLFEEKNNYSGLLNFIESILPNKRTAVDWELLISSYDKLDKLGNLIASDLPGDYCEKVIQLLEKKKANGLMSKPLNERSAAAWELLISSYDKLNMLGNLNPSELTDYYRKKVLQLFDKKKDFNSLMNFVQAIPPNERSAGDWDMLISSYDKLDKLGDIDPSGLTDEYCKKTIQLLEKKNDNSLLSTQQKERPASEWELLISLHDKLNTLGSLAPTGLPEDYRKKVILLLDKKKDYNSLRNFVQSIPPEERSAVDWELLISLYDKLNKLSDIDPSSLTNDYREKVIHLLDNKKDHKGLLNFIQLIPPNERSEANWDLLISLYDKLNTLSSLNPHDLTEDHRKKVIQLLDKKKDYNTLINFLQLIAPNERTLDDWDLLISLYDKLNKLSNLNPSELSDDNRNKVIQLFEKKKDNIGLINFIQLIPPNDRSADNLDLLISVYDKLNRLGELNPSDLSDDNRKKVIQLLEKKKDYKGLMTYLSHIPEKIWTVETYQLWYESNVKNGKRFNAIKSLSSIQKRTDAEAIYNFYYLTALELEMQGLKDEAALIYTRFINEHIPYKDAAGRYAEITGGTKTLQPTPEPVTPVEPFKTEVSMPSDQISDQSNGQPEPQGVTPAETAAQNTSPQDSPDTKYRILRELGRGKTAIVYAAMNRKTKKQVAIKKMKEDLSTNPQEKKSFIEEARKVAGLHHLNIISVYDVYEHGNSVCLELEYANGDTLDTLLIRYEQLKLKDALEIVLPVCSALENAHGQQILHKDIKPSNIIITKDKNIKLMDFGIARLAKDILARGKEIPGVFDYMAPEGEMGKFTAESDVYSLGIVLYEMLTGTIPFKGPSSHTQKRAMTFSPVRETIPDINLEIDKIIKRCLQVTKEKRYYAVRELAADLRNLANTL